MPRPVCCRRIGISPGFRCFGPHGGHQCDEDDIVLSVDELEAIRLADLEGMYHEQAAEEMGVSRQTLGRIIESARKKVAQALVNSKNLRIEGGNVKMENSRQFECYECKHTWELPHGTGRPAECPQCKSANIHRAASDRGWARAGKPGPGPCGRRGKGFGCGRAGQ